MATFRNLDRLAGQAGLAVENLRVMRMRQQADQLRQQRIAQEMQFRTMLKQKEIDAANLRQKKYLAYRDRADQKEFDADMAKILAKGDPNTAIRDKKTDPFTALTKMKGVADLLYGPALQSLSGEVNAMLAAKNDPLAQNKPTFIEIEAKKAQRNAVLRQQKDFLQKGMQQQYPDFVLPEWGGNVAAERAIIQATKYTEGKKGPMEGTEAGRRIKEKRQARLAQGIYDNTIQGGWTITGDSSKFSTNTIIDSTNPKTGKRKLFE